MRSAAQMVSYEIAMGFSLICVLMVSNSLNLVEIVNAQQSGTFAGWGLDFLSWNWLPLLPMFLVYLISGVAETNRAPFDLSEGESEIVAGFHVEYSGMAFAVFFLAEYANMILIAALTSIMFLGGWLSPVGFLPDGILWLFAKMAFILFLFLWFRATFPRYRYDQLMRLGWKVFLPICMIWLVVVGTSQGDELVLVAQRRQLVLEGGDLRVVEVLFPVEGRRAVVGQQLARAGCLDRLSEFTGEADIRHAGFAPDEVSVGRVSNAAGDGLLQAVLDTIEALS